MNPTLLATDGLMRSLFEHARNVEHVIWLALARATARQSLAFRASIADAGAILEALADAAEGGEVPSVGLLDAHRGRHRPHRVEWECAHPRRVPAVAPFRRSGPGCSTCSDRVACWRDSSRRTARCRPAAVPTIGRPWMRISWPRPRRIAELLAGSGDADDPIELSAVARVERPDALLAGSAAARCREDRHRRTRADRNRDRSRHAGRDRRGRTRARPRGLPRRGASAPARHRDPSGPLG